MEKRMIGIIGAFDQNGVYGIGPHLPWGDEKGRSKIRFDMGRFVEVTKKTAQEGKQNVLVIGKGTAEAMGFRPLPERRMIVLSQTLVENAVNVNLPEGKKIAIAKNVQQAVDRALSYEDCGNIFFAGGYEVWLQALKSDLCTNAFITVVKCDAVMKSPHMGDIRKAPEMILHQTFVGMECESIPLSDTWDDQIIDLEFHNYKKV
jgi:dihydrofolate reductase